MGLVLDKSLWRLNEKKNGEIWIIEFNLEEMSTESRNNHIYKS